MSNDSSLFVQVILEGTANTAVMRWIESYVLEGEAAIGQLS
jgi:hypothetical protein